MTANIAATTRPVLADVLRILLIDDHPLFLAGIRSVLSARAGAVEIFECTSAAAGERVLAAQPDLDFICVDLELPDRDGLSFIADLDRRRLPVPIIVLSAAQAPETVHRALKAGACAYIAKSTPGEAILAAFAEIARTGHYVSPELRAPLDAFRAGLHGVATGAVNLTERQHEVLQLLAHGCNNQEIASRLAVSVRTVKWHVSSLLALLDADNRTACAARARELGLLD